MRRIKSIRSNLEHRHKGEMKHKKNSEVNVE